MSENWDFYLARVDDQPASFYVDLGIAEEAPLGTHTHMSYVRLIMNSPRPDGLSSDEEFDLLIAIEDHLEKELTGDGSAVYVGRNTSDGCRDLYFYSSAPSEWKDRVNVAMQSFSTYRFDADTREDIEWQSYFGFLYPSGSALREILDRRDEDQRNQNRLVVKALEERGDPLTVSREIDHWAYFTKEHSRSDFIDGAQKLGFQVRHTSKLDEGQHRFGVQLFRVDAPSYAGIDDVTLPLFRLANDLSGKYDGWETPVKKGP